MLASKVQCVLHKQSSAVKLLVSTFAVTHSWPACWIQQFYLQTYLLKGLTGPAIGSHTATDTLQNNNVDPRPV
jgi:hypothetical protein